MTNVLRKSRLPAPTVENVALVAGPVRWASMETMDPDTQIRAAPPGNDSETRSTNPAVPLQPLSAGSNGAQARWLEVFSQAPATRPRTSMFAAVPMVGRTLVSAAGVASLNMATVVESGPAAATR